MKNNLIYILSFFLILEYALRTFVNSYKYHEVGYLLEFLPLVFATLITSIFYKKIIETKSFGLTYFKLVFVSVSGFLIAKSILFFQWYWFTAPEYRNIPGDMDEGLAWDILYFIVGSIVILLSYLIAMLIIKSKYKTVKI